MLGASTGCSPRETCCRALSPQRPPDEVGCAENSCSRRTREQFGNNTARTPGKSRGQGQPERKTSQHDREPGPACKTSIPGSNPGGASNLFPNKNRIFCPGSGAVDGSIPVKRGLSGALTKEKNRRVLAAEQRLRGMVPSEIAPEIMKKVLVVHRVYPLQRQQQRNPQAQKSHPKCGVVTGKTPADYAHVDGITGEQIKFRSNLRGD